MFKNICSILLFLFFNSCTNDPVTISGIESKSRQIKVYNFNFYKLHLKAVKKFIKYS